MFRKWHMGYIILVKYPLFVQNLKETKESSIVENIERLRYKI